MKFKKLKLNPLGRSRSNIKNSSSKDKLDNNNKDNNNNNINNKSDNSKDKSDNNTKSNKLDKSILLELENQKNIKNITKLDKQNKLINTISIISNAELISKYHAILKYISQVKNNKLLTQAEKDSKLEEYQLQLNNLGGIDAYQAASLSGETSTLFSSFNASKWVISHKFIENNTDNIRLLDVGAIKNHYINNNNNIECIAIDLHPQDSNVKCCDLLNYEDGIGFDAVVLSLVLNFEGDPRKRGQMIKHSIKLIEQKKSKFGLLFIVLPLACVENSRYFDKSLLDKMMNSYGFVLDNYKPSNRLALFVYKREEGKEAKVPNFGRRELKTGGTRNNFCIILKDDEKEEPKVENVKEKKLLFKDKELKTLSKEKGRKLESSAEEKTAKLANKIDSPLRSEGNKNKEANKLLKFNKKSEPIIKRDPIKSKQSLDKIKSLMNLEPELEVKKVSLKVKSNPVSTISNDEPVAKKKKLNK